MKFVDDDDDNIIKHSIKKSTESFIIVRQICCGKVIIFYLFQLDFVCFIKFR